MKLSDIGIHDILFLGDKRLEVRKCGACGEKIAVWFRDEPDGSHSFWCRECGKKIVGQTLYFVIVFEANGIRWFDACKTKHRRKIRERMHQGDKLNYLKFSRSDFTGGDSATEIDD